jgi:chromate reductase
MTKVAVIVGSLRRESINRRFAQALAALARGHQLDFEFVELADIPIYNEDLWADPPQGVTRFKQSVEAADAVLFVTPEYNRSVPPVVKNVLDWGSRPYGKSSWPGKPAGIVGTSGGAIGTAVAQAHLRHVAAVCDLRVMAQPEVYLVMRPSLISDTFEITDEKTREFLAGYLAKFKHWIDRHAKA